MINPKDLRIGNYLRIKESDTVIQVETHMLSVSELINYAPIVLSPEILEKCGFISNPYQDRYELGDIYVNYCGIKNICWIENAPHIEYLHQLQNYVYINTNKELTFKP